MIETPLEDFILDDYYCVTTPTACVVAKTTWNDIEAKESSWSGQRGMQGRILYASFKTTATYHNMHEVDLVKYTLYRITEETDPEYFL